MTQTGPAADHRTPADQAAEWLVRVQSDAATGADWLALEAWLAQSEEHRTAFERVELLASGVEDHRREIAAGLDPDEPTVGVVDLAARRRPTRRGWLVGAGAIAATLVAGVLGVSLLSGPKTTIYQTAPGQTRTLELADGSSVGLNGASRIAVTMTRGERRVTMADAEAAFDVARDPGRPFVINAGDHEIRVVGTEFNVREDARGLMVTVRRGVVDVRAPGSAAAARLTAGQQLFDPAGALGPIVREADADDAFAWTQRRLVVRDGRLEDVVTDLNRQLPTPMRVDGPARDLRFSGVLVLDDQDAVVRRLEDFLPVKAARSGEEIRLVSR